MTAERNGPSKGSGIGIAIGVAIGTALGAAMHQLALGVALGAAFGALIDVLGHFVRMRRSHAAPAADDKSWNLRWRDGNSPALPKASMKSAAS